MGAAPIGPSVLGGPIERDCGSGTCRPGVRLAGGCLRPPLAMRLGLDRWSATSTALQLIPCQRVRLSAAYFRAGHHLLSSLTQALAQPAAVQAQPARQEQGIERHRRPAPIPAP